MKKDIIKKVQINLPLRMANDYLESYIKFCFNPEIGIDCIVLDTISLKESEKIAKKFHDNGRNITMHGPFLDLSIASPDMEIRTISRKRIYSVVDYIKAINPKSIVFHPGFDFRRYEHIKEDWCKLSCDFWGELAYTLKKIDVILNVENVYERGPREILDIVEAVYENGGGFCFDTGHHYAFGEEKIENWINELGKYMKEIHFHDNDGVNDLHLPPGNGDINFNPLLDFLNKKENNPQITLEPHSEDDLWPCFSWFEKNNFFKP